MLGKVALLDALGDALDQAKEFCVAHGIDLGAIANSRGFDRIARIDDAVEAILVTEADKKAYLQIAARASRLFKAVLPDVTANELAPMAVLIAYLAAKIRAETEQADISGVMADVEELLNDSIATSGYRMPAPHSVPLINLSEIDLPGLEKRFTEGHKRTEAEKLRRLIAGKLEAMVRLNSARADFAARFQKLIDEYNAGSRNVEQLFRELVKFARELTEEERRGVSEGLTEEELALFDILTKPEPILSKAEEADVKRVCKELLDTLKREKLVLDWREKQQAKAAVMQTIKLDLRRLPAPYTADVRTEKFARAFAHIYDKYTGAGRSAYQQAAIH